MKVLSLIAALGIMTMLARGANAQTSENRQADGYSFDTTQAIKQLLATWYDLAITDDLPLESRQHSTRDAYALLFELWLVTEYQHKPIFIAANGVENIVKLAERYADINDPMSIDHLYAGNTLSSLGTARVRSYPMIGTEEIFKDKQTYRSLVTQFQAWENHLKRN